MSRVQSEEAWIRLFRDTLAPLYAFVSRRAGADRALAEDVTQEAWLRAIRAWRRAGPPSEPLAWLQTTARNLLANHFRDERSRPLEGGGRALAERLAADEAVPGVATTPELALWLRHGLARLGRRDAELLESFHLDGQSTRELAVLHGIGERAVEGRLRRAREKLRRILVRSDRGPRTHLVSTARDAAPTRNPST